MGSLPGSLDVAFGNFYIDLKMSTVDWGECNQQQTKTYAGRSCLAIE
jgi:hypothetical protein